MIYSSPLSHLRGLEGRLDRLGRGEPRLRGHGDPGLGDPPLDLDHLSLVAAHLLTP